MTVNMVTRTNNNSMVAAVSMNLLLMMVKNQINNMVDNTQWAPFNHIMIQIFNNIMDSSKCNQVIHQCNQDMANNKCNNETTTTTTMQQQGYDPNYQ